MLNAAEKNELIKLLTYNDDTYDSGLFILLKKAIPGMNHITKINRAMELVNKIQVREVKSK